MDEKWDQKRLEALISDEVEESLNPDYKAAAALEKTDDKRREITKDVSSFANSDGGIIIYGISEYKKKEKKHLPNKLTPVDRTQFSREWLEHVTSNIRPKISGLLIHSVSLDSGSNDVAYVVEIPKTTTAHQAQDKRYYRRSNFESIALEDYEIRQTMNRSIYPSFEVSSLLCTTSIEPDRYWTEVNISERIKVLRFEFALTIENTSLVWANDVRGGIIGWGMRPKPNLTQYLRDIIEIYPADINNNYSDKVLNVSDQKLRIRQNINLSPLDSHNTTSNHFDLPTKIGHKTYFQNWIGILYLIAENSPPSFFEIQFSVNLETVNLESNSRIRAESSQLLDHKKLTDIAPIISCKITGGY